MKRIVEIALLGALFCPLWAFSQQTQGAGQDMKDAGSQAKGAAKDTGSAVKKTAKKGKRKTKSGVSKAAKKTKEGAGKVQDKTSNP